MSEEKITRGEVDKLAAQILINFGLINGAALGAALAGADRFQILPFSIGLIAAVFSQIMWYVDSVLEYSFDGREIFSDPISVALACLFSCLAIVGAGALSGGSIVYGCFYLMGFPSDDALLYAILICGLPLVALFYSAFRKSFHDAKNEKL